MIPTTWSDGKDGMILSPNAEFREAFAPVIYENIADVLVRRNAVDLSIEFIISRKRDNHRAKLAITIGSISRAGCSQTEMIRWFFDRYPETKAKLILFLA